MKSLLQLFSIFGKLIINTFFLHCQISQIRCRQGIWKRSIYNRLSFQHSGRYIFTSATIVPEYGINLWHNDNFSKYTRNIVPRIHFDFFRCWHWHYHATLNQEQINAVIWNIVKLNQNNDRRLLPDFMDWNVKNRSNINTHMNYIYSIRI